MHVLFLCDEYPPPVVGGIGQVVRLLARGLVARGHRATVAGQYWGDYREYDDEGVCVIKLSRPRKYRITRNEVSRRWLLARVVHRLIRERDVDIVESPSYMGDGAFLKGYGKGSAFHILRSHGTDSVRAKVLGYRPRRFSRLLEQRALSRCDSLVLVGRGAGQDYLRILGRPDMPHVVIPNPIDTDSFRPLDLVDLDKTLLYIGRIDELKGAFALAKALPAVLEQFPDVRVRFAGAESYREPGTGRSGSEVLCGFLEEDQQKQLVFLGRLSHAQLIEEINRAAVCVLPSLSENFPCAVLEVMSCARPVIGSRRAHGEEVLVHGESGLLVDPFDQHELSNAIIELLCDPERRRELGESARTLVEKRCSLDVVMAANIRYYESCLAAKPLTGELLPLNDFRQTHQVEYIKS